MLGLWPVATPQLAGRRPLSFMLTFERLTNLQSKMRVLS